MADCYEKTYTEEEARKLLKFGYKLTRKSWQNCYGPNSWIRYVDSGVVIDEKHCKYSTDSVMEGLNDWIIYDSPKPHTSIDSDTCNDNSDAKSNSNLEYDPEWLKKIFEFCRAEEYKGRIKCSLFGKDKNGVVVIDLISGNAAIAKCHPDDDFNIETGCAIAYARLRGMTPKLIPAGRPIKELVGAKVCYKGHYYRVIKGLREIDGYYLVNTNLTTLIRNELYALIKKIPANTIIPNKDISFD